MSFPRAGTRAGVIAARLMGIGGGTGAERFAGAPDRTEPEAPGAWYGRKEGRFGPPSKSVIHRVPAETGSAETEAVHAPSRHGRRDGRRPGIARGHARGGARHHRGRAAHGQGHRPRHRRDPRGRLPDDGEGQRAGDLRNPRTHRMGTGRDRCVRGGGHQGARWRRAPPHPDHDAAAGRGQPPAYKADLPCRPPGGRNRGRADGAKRSPTASPPFPPAGGHRKARSRGTAVTGPSGTGTTGRGTLASTGTQAPAAEGTLPSTARPATPWRPRSYRGGARPCRRSDRRNRSRRCRRRPSRPRTAGGCRAGCGERSASCASGTAPTRTSRRVRAVRGWA